MPKMKIRFWENEYENVTVTRLPKKIPKTAIRERYRFVWVINHITNAERKRLAKKWAKKRSTKNDRKFLLTSTRSV